MRILRANYDKKIYEYEELLGLRIQLEQEIATLSALLQEEEIRYIHCIIYNIILSVQVHIYSYTL